MTSLKIPSDNAADVVVTVHVFTKGYKREGSTADLIGRGRTSEELDVYAKNWHLRRTIKMPYHPQPGTRISFPVAPEDKRNDHVLDAARGLGLPSLGLKEHSALLVVKEVTYWVGDGLDHAACEIEAPDDDAAWNVQTQLKGGFGFEVFAPGES